MFISIVTSIYTKSNTICCISNSKSRLVCLNNHVSENSIGVVILRLLSDVVLRNMFLRIPLVICFEDVSVKYMDVFLGGVIDDKEESNVVFGLFDV